MRLTFAARFLIALLFTGVMVKIHAASFPLAWNWSNPLPHGNHVYDLYSDEDDVLMAGDKGQAYISDDLDTWMPLQTGTTKSLRSITYLNGKGIISGAEGGIVFGSSLANLSPISLQTTDWLEGVASSPVIAVAVGDNGAIYSSSDGANWTRRGNFNYWFRSVAYGNGVFSAVGENGKLVQSPDGIAWTERSLPATEHLNKITWISDRFWSVGENGVVLTNTARGTWSLLPKFSTNTFTAVAGNGSDVVIAGDGAVYLLRNNTGVWTSQTSSAMDYPAPVWPYYSAVWDGRLFLLGGRSGMLVEGIATNNTPYAWVNREDSVRSWLWSLTANDSIYIASGADGVIMSSSDGVGWNREVVPASAIAETLLGVRATTNLAVAVGTKGTVLVSPNTLTNAITTNPDGAKTTNEVSLLGVVWEATPRPATVDLQGIAITPSQFIVTGSGGAIWSRTSRGSWVQRTSGTQNYLSSIAEFPGGFAAVGDNGTILFSADGVAWSSHGPGGANWIYTVKYLNGGLVAVGENGVIYTSSNGTSWTPHSSGTSKWLNDVTYAGGIYFAVGTDGLLLTSADTVNWTPRDTVTSKSLYGAETKGGQLVVAGLEGTILRSQVETFDSPVAIVEFSHRQDRNIYLFKGVRDQKFVIEKSSDLRTWISGQTHIITDPEGSYILNEPEAASFLFIRTRLVR